MILQYLRNLAIFLVILPVLLIASGCSVLSSLKDEPAVDEARAAGKTPADFPELALDLFRDMDGGIALAENEIKGRNTWVIWTAGNQAFWDYLANHSFGAIDLLKLLDTRKRGKRFEYYGVMNDPGLRQAAQPDQYGLWLDAAVEPEPAAVDKDVYGRPSGIVGLRLFDNPNFDAQAQSSWDAGRFYNDPDYYLNPELVRPYRVGMSCGFCHIAPNPLNPPADPEQPQWANLSNNIGNQYFWVGRIFTNNLAADNFIWQLFNSSPPGALDTSFIATDNINNPRTMNSIYEVGARLGVAEEEDITGGALNVGGTQPHMAVPHVLKDGADSIGILGALSRVYINIGEYHQEWLKHFRPMIGGRKQTPLQVTTARQNSVYWLASEQRVGNLAAFFLKAATPQRLADAPGGARYLSAGSRELSRGKQVFADQCAQCHSSKQPQNMQPGTAEYRVAMRDLVAQPDFLDNNFLSTDKRYPVTEVQTNACAALATNATDGHIWDNFSSQTYKSLPSVGTIEVQHPLDGSTSSYRMPAGGRGYLRAPSLVSLWASAPFFHNNSLGLFNSDPSVAGRMTAFDDAVEKLLWPQRRADTGYCQQRWGMPFCPPIYRTTQESYLVIYRQFIPELLRNKLLDEGEDALRLGPIPKGTPVNLLANINLELSLDPVRLLRLGDAILKIKKSLKIIKRDNLNAEQSTALLSELVDDVLEVSKCPDFVVDRGHYYGTDLEDADKRALIGFLKTI
jgi:hypothetical protein